MKVAVIGGGAAGFFAAICVKENYPQASVTIYEKSSKLLSKVKVSGGGRCNVTNGCTSIADLLKAYPRGGKALKKGFHVFSTGDAMHWFSSRGVPLVVQNDNCVFPQSQDSQSIIDCFLRQAKKLNITIETRSGIASIHTSDDDRLTLEFVKQDMKPEVFDKVIVATGGSPQRKGLAWLERLNHKIEDPVPSLFTFNIPDTALTALQGIVVENVLVKIQGTKFSASGPLLITHWGMSGPAILLLSAFGARYLHAQAYAFTIAVNWVQERNADIVMTDLAGIADEHANKILANFRPYALPDRLWRYLLEKSGFTPSKRWGELGKKGMHKLLEVLTHDVYAVRGKTTFKEEFVTCGGVSLDSVNLDTMQSKVCNNLYFAGEILDIDGITGGYNFQAAWTTAFIAAKLG